MKKIVKSFTFWFLLIALFEIYMHQIGQDSKSIVLISLNPILSIISRTDSFLVFMDSGMQIPCRTIMGSISIYWYIASILSFLIYGIILDLIRVIISKIVHKTK
ncbi:MULTISPECIES: hypothetical protein [Clostridioides]|uniref:hypothetical protein n=1 Tax=unclassified Clostridioides TaxID=2635829 RepID=UPI0005C6EC24|nr:hypothetical protein [Clostridioides difficile]MCC0715856.1 hypothetical protein [Clostridioides sp. ES-S-0077-01]UDN54311.1 hypothetical protein JJC02_15765 [Clostridioides sp. ES-S-0054-01]